MGGYTPMSDVSSHSKIALDICDIETLVDDSNFDGAKKVYSDGSNAVASDEGAFRTLESMAEKQSTLAMWAEVFQKPRYVNCFLSLILDGASYSVGCIITCYEASVV
jgi:hypothetical protein